MGHMPFTLHEIKVYVLKLFNSLNYLEENNCIYLFHMHAISMLCSDIIIVVYILYICKIIIFCSSNFLVQVFGLRKIAFQFTFFKNEKKTASCTKEVIGIDSRLKQV